LKGKLFKRGAVLGFWGGGRVRGGGAEPVKDLCVGVNLKLAGIVTRVGAVCFGVGKGGEGSRHGRG